MRKIKTKITLIILVTIILVSAILGFMSTEVTKKATEKTIISILSETVSVAASSAQSTMATYLYTVGEIATAPLLSDPNVSPAAKKAVLDAKVKTYYMRSAGLADLGGKDLFTGENVGGEAFFQAALTGKPYMSTPYISDDKQDMHIIVSAPVRSGEEITSVLFFRCDATILSEIIKNISIGETGDAYILDKDGYTIAYSDLSLVLNQSNAIAEAEANPEDKDLRDLAAIEAAMIQGEAGFDRYVYEGIHTFQSYTPIPGSDGWSIAVSVNEHEFMGVAIRGSIFMAILSASICLISVIVASMIGGKMSKPIVSCTQRLSQLAQGDLTSPMVTVKGRDEISVLAKSIGELIHGFQFMISDISNRLSSIAAGDLSLPRNTTRYKGDFAKVQESLENINDSLNEMICSISSAADQVLCGSDQVALGASALSQSSAEQVNSVETLSGAMFGINNSILQVAESSSNATQISAFAREKLLEGNGYMADLVSAMQEIEKKAEGISKIIKTIDDIAFQTNILALNAAVEAARAGATGKGFAVVAEEVRNLANKSAEAAKNTTQLIESSVASTQKGAELAQVTADTLQQVMTRAKKSNQYIASISQEIKEQSTAVSGVKTSLEQISSIIQANSATSEESAASSQELSSQANMLKDLVSKFKTADVIHRLL